MKRRLLKISIMGAALTLSACSSSSTNNSDSLISSDEEVLRVFADDGVGGSQDFADVLARGDVLAARQVAEATFRENFDDDTTTSVDGDVRLQLVGDDLLVTIATAGDANPTIVTIPNATTLNENSFRIDDVVTFEFFDIFLGGDLTFAELVDGDRDAAELTRIGIFYAGPDDDFGLNTRVVIGTETTDARIGELIAVGGSVDYSGFGSMTMLRQDAGFNTYNAQLSGDMTFTADFGSGSVSGEMANPDFRERIVGVETNEVLAGTVLFDDATIRDNAFVGDVSVDQAFETGNSDSAAGAVADVSYGGAFYGEDGTAIGGSIGGTGQVGGDDYVVIGNFEVYQD